jgi:hypothetical protein
MQGNCEDLALKARYNLDSNPMFLRAQFTAKDIVTGEPAVQHTRKWLLSEHMTRSEIVATALKCVLTSEEHEAREDFTYRGQRIFGPHFDVEYLVSLCEDEATDVRPAR